MNAGDSSESVREVRVIAPINIALVKYWGKRNEVFFSDQRMNGISVTVRVSHRKP